MQEHHVVNCAGRPFPWRLGDFQLCDLTETLHDG